MNLSELDYRLPRRLIAQEPLADRAGSRMLVVNGPHGELQDSVFRALGSFLTEGDLLVINTTRVSARRLFGVRETGGRVEVLTMNRLPDGDFEALVRPAKKLREGEVVKLEDGLTAEIIADLGEGRKRVRLEPVDGLDAALARAGEAPLPPYITERLKDEERYQTVYAQMPGSAAAPTAGLHFTEDVLEGLKVQGIGVAEVHLTVSLDTFRPVMVEDLNEHPMHGEDCYVPEKTAAAVAACKGRVVAVGTTSARTLEAASLGPKNLEPGHRRTNILIQPGHTWQTVDALLTNFHMPRTTMLAMVAALTGRAPMMRAYEMAVDRRYRFLSFGDCMLAFPQKSGRFVKI